MACAWGKQERISCAGRYEQESGFFVLFRAENEVSPAVRKNSEFCFLVKR
jgi:hypothetical protein